MYTYQMVGVADQNGKTYECKYGEYSKDKGFSLSDEGRNTSKCMLIDKMFHEDCWSLKNTKKRMSKKEIEDILGYEVEISDFEFSDEERDELRQKIRDMFNGNHWL